MTEHALIIDTPMARPRSDDKRNAILAAASQLIAEVGVEASTARVAREAGVAEGTLFLYFGSKDALLNALHVALHGLLAAATMAGDAPDAPLEARVRQAWHRAMAWRRAYPADVRTLAQLDVLTRITPESRATVAAAQGALRRLLSEVAARGGLRDAPPDLVVDTFATLGDRAAALALRDPAAAGRYADAGYLAFWRAVGAP
jgi:AcrR family transcriptional regulator